MKGAGSDWRSDVLPRRLPFAAMPGPTPIETKPSRGCDVVLDRSQLLANNIFGFDYLDDRAQPFVLLRSQFLSRTATTGGRVIAVTSTQPRNGKSFVAANLAAALSHIHAVHLVDLDLRQPTVGDRFGLPQCGGSDDFLRSQHSLHDLGCTVAGTKLTIVPVSRAVENSADLLASPRATQLFDGLRKTTGPSVCILDTPPIFEGDDLMIIARHVDGILLVVEQAQTRQREVREALRMLGSTPLVGTVLNKAFGRIGLSNSYRYGSRRSSLSKAAP